MRIEPVQDQGSTLPPLTLDLFSIVSHCLEPDFGKLELKKLEVSKWVTWAGLGWVKWIMGINESTHLYPFN